MKRRRPVSFACSAWLQRLCSAVVLVGGWSTAQASGLERLEAFVRSTRSGQAEFTQQVTTPAREGQPARTRNSSGSFEFLRPDRFRFDYRKPFEQTIVADGQTLWLYDVDLNQVTARKQAAVLASTPAAVIAGAVDLKGIESAFRLSNAPDRDGLEWVLAVPRNPEGALQSVRVGMRGDTLAVLEMVDSFGQQSVIRFGPLATPPIGPGRFQFKPPAGADLLRQ